MYLSQFKTQREAKDFVRNFMATQPLGITTDPFYTMLLDHHPYKELKIGSGIKQIEITRDCYGAKLINLKRMDDTYTTISWVTCATGKKNEDLTPAMREAIQEDIDTFSNTATKVCVFCLSTDNPQIDHIIPFKYHQTIFMTDREAPITFLKCPITLRPVLKESTFKEEWKAYHRDKATLQVLCRSCNLKKGQNLC